MSDAYSNILFRSIINKLLFLSLLHLNSYVTDWKELQEKRKVLRFINYFVLFNFVYMKCGGS